MLKQKHQILKILVIIKKCIVGKENKENMGSFQDINFADIFASMDEEILEDIAINDPKQLLRMCTFLTLDHQIRKEGLTKTPEGVITD